MVTVQTNPIRVLVVDDHPPVRAGIRAMLSGLSRVRPCVVDDAETTEDALALIDQVGYEVVLMDYSVPGILGDKATRLILTRRPETRVIALSNYTDRAYVERMVKAGARGYVAKTIDAEALYTAIRQVMDGRPYYSPEVAAQWMTAAMFPGAREASASLTLREQEVIRLVLTGMRDKEIGAKMFLSARTVEKHRHNAMMKLGVHNAVELVVEAVRIGMIQ